MQLFTPASANIVTLDMVAKASGSAITSGTVTFYLKAKTGANAGKWFRASDSSWQASEASAGAATYSNGDAEWSLSITSAAWIDGVKYSLYGKESGSLNIPYSDSLETNANTTTPPTVSEITADIDANSTQLNAILEDIVDVKGTGFVKDTNSLVDLTASAAINWTVGATIT